MQNESSKNDLLKEIVNLSKSNMDNLDLMIDTSKFGNIMKDFQQIKKRNSMKQIRTNKISEFNNGQSLSIKPQENQKNQNKNIKMDNNNNIKIDESVRNQSIQGAKNTNNIFDEADDILNNFNKKLKINKSLSNNIEKKLNPILEENENSKEDKKQEKTINLIKEVSNNEEKTKIETNEKNENKLSMKSLEFEKEKNKKALGSIFDMLDIDNNNIGKKNNIISSKELSSNKNFEDMDNYKKEITVFEEINEEIYSNNRNNSSDIMDIENDENKTKKTEDNKEEKGKVIKEEIEEIKREEKKEEKEEKEIIIKIEKEDEKKEIEEEKEKKEQKEEIKEKEEIKKEKKGKKEEIKEEEIDFKKEEIKEVIIEEIKERKKVEISKEEEKLQKDSNLEINENKKDINISEIKENKIENNNKINDKINDKTENNNKNCENKIKTENKKLDIENNKINIKKEDKNQDIEIINIYENISKEEIPENVLTDTKIDLVEKIEHPFFLKEKNLSELQQYLNNNIHKLRESIQLKKEKSEKIFYDITQSFPKNKLLTEFFQRKMTSIYLDTEEFIYCGEEKGNLLIYSIKEEKLIKQLENPFLENKNNKSYPCINSISADGQYIIAGYEKGKFAIFLKNEKRPAKTKIYDAFQEISQHNIIEAKIYSKKKNSILIYSCDDQENIFRTKIIKNKIFKNKVYTNRITGGLKNVDKKEPYYYLEINPFWYKCIGVVNNRGVNIYIIKKCKKDIIFKWDNLDEINGFLSFFFSPKEEEKYKFFISNMNMINIYEINSDYTGVAQQNAIILENKIIQIGYFINDLLYAFNEKNKIKLVNYNDTKRNKNKEYGFFDTISINENDNNDIIKDKEKENFEFLLNYKNFISIKDGIIFIYNNNNILFIKSLSLDDGVTNIYNSTFNAQNEKWDILFKVGIEIFNKKHPLWKVEHMNKYQELFMNYSQSFLSLLIVQLGNNSEDKRYEFRVIINKFNELISFLFKVELYSYLTNEKNNLYSVFLNSNLEDLYFYLLEPYIIEDKFIDKANVPISFINNLMDIYLNKKNKESKFLKNSKSWLCELLVHFDIKKYIEKGKNKGLLDNIKENYLINTIIYFILNYNSSEVMINNLIDYSTPLNLLIRLLKLNIKNQYKNKNNEQGWGLEVDLKNEELFKKEFRYKDEIIFSTEYLRIKIIWYIYIVLKNKILDDSQEKVDENKKASFIKEVIKIILDKDLFNIIVFASFNNNENNKNKGYYLDKEMMYILQIIFDNEKINKYNEFNKEEILQKLIHLFKNKKEEQISLNILLVKSLINDKGLELSNEIKFNLVLFFMENNCLKSDVYPEIKEIIFQEHLIEILKLIDSFTYDDTSKLTKLTKICGKNYGKLVNYIKTAFNS